MLARSMDLSSAKELGAFYTPHSMAQAIAEWSIRTGKEHLLEPSVGSGALLNAACMRSRQLLSGNVGVSAVACDIDQAAIEQLESQASQLLLLHRNFLEVQVEETGRVDVVVMNPPFTRNHSLPSPVRADLRSRFAVSGSAGLWVYFLLHACSFLKSGGRLACVVPASATFSNYGKAAMAQVARRFKKVELRRLVDLPEWSQSAEEKGAVFLADGFERGCSEPPQLTSWNSLGERVADFFAGDPAYFRRALGESIPLGQLAEFSIGAVTGLNRVFLMSESERIEFGISLKDVRPVVARSRHAKGIILDDDHLLKLSQSGEKTWLLYPTELGAKGSPVRRRLAQIQASKRRTTLWLNKRSPWWKVDLSENCDGFFTYMNHEGPRIVLSEGRARCTNTLHQLRFFRTISRQQRIAVALTQISTFGQLAAELGGRSYGGGILKFELQDVRLLPSLSGNARCRLENLKKVHSLAVTGKSTMATALANEILLEPIFGTDWSLAATEMQKELQARRSERNG